MLVGNLDSMPLSEHGRQLDRRCEARTVRRDYFTSLYYSVRKIPYFSLPHHL